MYPAEIVIPMKEELTENGFDELLTPASVDEILSSPGTTLVVVNSVCGCSAGSARPGVLMSVHNSTKRPDHLTTAFAGFDLANFLGYWCSFRAFQSNVSFKGSTGPSSCCFYFFVRVS